MWCLEVIPMTEQELRQIHINNIALARLQAEYDEVCGNTGVSPMQSDGMPHGSSKTTGMEGIERKVDIETEYRVLYTTNERLIARARKYIEQFPDEILRMVLTKRYINGLDCIMTAADVGISMQQCEMICMVHFNNVF